MKNTRATHHSDEVHHREQEGEEAVGVEASAAEVLAGSVTSVRKVHHGRGRFGGGGRRGGRSGHLLQQDTSGLLLLLEYAEGIEEGREGLQ